METFETVSEGESPVVGEIHLLEPFIAATRAAVGEMVGGEIGVRKMVRTVVHHAFGDIAAVIGLSKKGDVTAASPGSLALSFPQRTAAALAQRILTGTTIEMDQKLINDCMGEIANVVAGQAKALLAETRYQFVFALPPTVVDAREFQPQPGLDCLLVGFTTDHGEFAMQLSLAL